MGDYKTLEERIDISKLRWLERRCLESLDPLNLFLNVIGAIIIIYGLWINILGWVAIGIIIMLIGHAYVWSKAKRKKTRNKK